MDIALYLPAFEKAAGRFDSKLLAEKQLAIVTGVWLDSVVLRMQKKHWANAPDETPQSGAAVFFSIWLNDKTIQENRLCYNIHALRLRQLKGYKLTSRAFATAFRTRFAPLASRWPHVSVDFGPLTLMEGWERLEVAHLQQDVFTLVSKFLEIDTIIDELLEEYKVSVK